MIVTPRVVSSYRRLPAHQRLLLLRAFVLLALTDGVLRVGRLRRFAWKRLIASDAVSGGGDIERARMHAHWIDVAARHHVVAAHCLHRSLVLQYVLQREGLPSRLRIGVRKEDGQLRAHAWVEVAGSVVNDWPESVAEFAPLNGSPAVVPTTQFTDRAAASHPEAVRAE